MASDPVSSKVSNGGLAGLAVSVITGLLVYYIPAWHSGIPDVVRELIVAGVGVAGYVGAGWLSRHRPTPAEVARAVAEARAMLATETVLLPPRVAVVEPVAATEPAEPGPPA